MLYRFESIGSKGEFMEKYVMIWVLVNYIFSIAILFVSILKHWSLFTFLKNGFYLVAGANLILIILSLIIKTFNEKNESEQIIDMIIPSESEDEGKQILKEASQLESANESESEFQDWTPEN